MSIAPIGGRLFDGSGHKTTTATLREQKLRHEPITCLTAYDYAAARLVDEAGIDMVLVGDSLAQTMLGYENTLSVTVEEMLHHVKAVRRGVKDALLIADMPYGSYQVDPKDAIRNAARFVKEGGAEAVKMEGGEKRVDMIRRVIDAEIPVAGHIGLTPQSVNVMGGYKVQGKTLNAVEQLMRDAVALDRAVGEGHRAGVEREPVLAEHGVSVQPPQLLDFLGDLRIRAPDRTLRRHDAHPWDDAYRRRKRARP